MGDLMRPLCLLLAGALLCPALAAQQSPPEKYVIRAENPDTLRLPEPELPDLSGYTTAAVKQRVPSTARGYAELVRMVDLKAFDEFVGGDERLADWAMRQRTNPVAIVLRGGLMTPADIARSLPQEQFARQAGGVYVARLPILVSSTATLLIDGRTTELRLSQEAGSFLVNDGKLFLIETRLTGWSEARDATARYSTETEFRPFLLSWGGTETYVADTVISSLGYAASKSYGFSISQYSPAMHHIMNREEPTGWIIGSTFDDMHYGFYCYEANDVVIVGNTYRNNIVYGIDPHDRSERLIIARNTAYGTKKKHGIIISREVNNSYLFENESYDNKLSGIMLDRQSVNNIVAFNKVHGNGADGITIYESPDNLLWSNESIGNGNHGFRVRNSTGIKLYHNRAINNQYTGINGHTKVLAAEARDLELDPYDTNISLVVVGGRLVHNNGGPIAIDEPVSVELYDVDMVAPANESGVSLSGVLGEHLYQVMNLMVREKKAVVIEPGNIKREVDG